MELCVGMKEHMLSLTWRIIYINELLFLSVSHGSWRDCYLISTRVCLWRGAWVADEVASFTYTSTCEYYVNPSLVDL